MRAAVATLFLAVMVCLLLLSSCARGGECGVLRPKRDYHSHTAEGYGGSEGDPGHYRHCHQDGKYKHTTHDRDRP